MAQEFWVFQANPNRYRIVEALRNTNDNSNWNWMVNQHKKFIKEGDKVILWVGGKAAGVYALATVTSSIKDMKDKPGGYAIDPSMNDSTDRVDLYIDYNLSDNPILKSKILSVAELKNMKHGIRGITNLRSQKLEYDAILTLIQKDL